MPFAIFSIGRYSATGLRKSESALLLRCGFSRFGVFAAQGFSVCFFFADRLRITPAISDSIDSFSGAGCLPFFGFGFFRTSFGSVLPTTRRFLSHLKKAITYEESGSPETPISANKASGSAVRQRMIIRTVSERSRENTGTPTAAASTPASITFRILNIPPNKVLPSIEFGGMM